MVLVADGVQRFHRALRRAEEQRASDLVDANARGTSILSCCGVSSSVFTSIDIRRMNNSAASTTPTVTAITMSNTTVSVKHVSITITSCFGAMQASRKK